MTEKRFDVGMLVFPGMTQLDLTGPLQVFSSITMFAPHLDVKIHLLWKDLAPVATDSVMTVTPTTTLAECPPLDLICIPGGQGTDALLGDGEVLDFVRLQGENARYVTSVCTGALVLGAAGLLRGYRAVTHWSALAHLDELGAIPTDARVVIDRNRITGGGVTAGIDFALTVVEELVDRATAEVIQLRLEYDPAPPFDSGSPASAPAEIVTRYRDRAVAGAQRRAEAVARAATRLAR